MKKLINFIVLAMLVSVNVFTLVSYAQFDTLQVSTSETVDQNFSSEINEGWDPDNEDQNVDKILEDKVGETTSFDDYNRWEKSEKEDEEKTWVEDIPEVSDNMWWSLIDIVENVVDGYSEAEEPKIKELKVENLEVEESKVENEALKSVLLWDNVQIVQDLELYFVDQFSQHLSFSLMDRNLWATEIYNQDWHNINPSSIWQKYSYPSDSMCPEWYHVPSTWEWKNLKDAWYYSSYGDVFNFTSDLLLPSTGTSNDIDAGKYWTSTPFDENEAYYFNFGGVWHTDRSEELPVRCFKDNFGWNLEIEPYGWYGVQVVVHDGIITSLWTPHRDNSIFEWWYSSENFDDTNLVRTWIYAPQNLYAKWWCNEIDWYFLSWWNCIKWSIVKFNAEKNWWTTDTGLVVVPYWTTLNLSEYVASKGSWNNWEFIGWGTSNLATEPILTYNVEDSSETTFYALFRQVIVTVTFETNGHWQSTFIQMVNVWENVIMPSGMVEDWYVFEWRSDNEYLITNFNFDNSIVTEDMILYAKWKVPWSKCYEWFEYDNNLWMCIKKNEWVIRVWMNWTVLLSSKYSDLVDWYISMQYSWIDLSKVQGVDIAKSYLWVILSEEINNNFLDIHGEWLNPNWGIMEILAWSWEDKELLFTMITKWICRGEEPDLSCKFYSLDTIKADNISSWDNVSILIPDKTKEETPPEFLERFEWADNIRIIFDPRAFITFDSNGHWNAPAPQFVNEWGRINKPQSPSAEWYNFLGWSEDAYLTSIFDFNTIVDKDTKLYAKWGSIWSNWYSCPEWQEYDDSVGLCKKPKDWVIRIWYQWDMEFSSWYLLFLDNALFSGDIGMSESELEAFKKAFWILMAAEIFDWTDEIVIDEDGIIPDGNLWLLDYLNKDWKVLFTVVVDMEWSDFTSLRNMVIHTRSMYVNVASNVSSSDNLKLTPSSTDINEYVEVYPPIAQLENLWIIFSDRMEPNIIDNWWNYYSGWWGHQRSTKENDKVDEHFSAESQDDIQDNPIEWWEYFDEFQQAYKFAYKNWITTMDTIQNAEMDGYMTRIEMAKMLSQYAVNVLWEMPDITRYNKFVDVPDDLDAEYNGAVSLAYQLWIMWINMPDNKFRPNDYVTRAEFATALSRMLYGMNDWMPNYYSTHFEKLKSEWVITILDPNMLEIRWYVMLMMMRSAK